MQRGSDLRLCTCLYLQIWVNTRISTFLRIYKGHLLTSFFRPPDLNEPPYALTHIATSYEHNDVTRALAHLHDLHLPSFDSGCSYTRVSRS